MTVTNFMAESVPTMVLLLVKQAWIAIVPETFLGTLQNFAAAVSGDSLCTGRGDSDCRQLWCSSTVHLRVNLGFAQSYPFLFEHEYVVADSAGSR